MNNTNAVPSVCTMHTRLGWGATHTDGRARDSNCDGGKIGLVSLAARQRRHYGAGRAFKHPIFHRF